MLFGTAEACRWVWNQAVSKLRDEYEWKGKCDYRFYTLGKWFTTLRNQNPWLLQYSAGNVRDSLKPIETAYKKFFKHKDSGLPKFRGRYNTTLSFALATNKTFRVNRNSDAIYIQRIGWMGLSGNNPYRGCKAVSGRVKHENGKWYVYLVYKTETEQNQNTKLVGVDRNVGNIALSDNRIIELPQVDSLIRKRTRYQRQMARRRKGSKRYLVSKSRAGRAYAKMANIRLNWAHHASRTIANDYGTVVLETLQTKKMTRKGHKNLTRGILESCWGSLEQKLGYKMRVINVNPAYTSQTCNACGARGKRQERGFACACGYRAHADTNAAKNILARGVESLDKALKPVEAEPVHLKRVA